MVSVYQNQLTCPINETSSFINNRLSYNLINFWDIPVVTNEVFAHRCFSDVYQATLWRDISLCLN